MSQIRTAKAQDTEAFPGTKFVVNDTPPIAQCQEAQIVAINADSTEAGNTFTKVGAFAGIDLAGKIATETAVPPNSGDYTIISNTDDVLIVTPTTPVASGANLVTVHDPGQAYLTRNESSFTRYIENQSGAHTTKGGQLYTDITDPPMNGACSDTWAPE